MDKAAAIDLAGILGGAKDYIEYLSDPAIVSAVVELAKVAPPFLTAAEKVAAAIQAHNANKAKA